MWNIQEFLKKYFKVPRKPDIEDGYIDGKIDNAFQKQDIPIFVGLKEIIIHKLFR
jgi:hypothetical protein